MSARAKTAGVVAAVVGLSFSPGASAFCRTTTCDPNDPSENCQRDANNCLLTGHPLAWRSSCVTVGVQQQGSPKQGLGYDDVAAVVEQAFGAWQQADCGDGEGPSIEIKLIGPIECGLSEYNQKVGNANVVLFREDDWPYVGAANAIGLTTTRFDTRTGDLWDADIELNAVGQSLSIGDPIQGDDLLSVLTHEAGHFLGLSHSRDQEATMREVYDPGRDGDSFRSLAQDDVDGICAIYPVGRKPATTSCENRHGFSSQCGADQPLPDESSGCSLNTRAGAVPSRAGLVAMLLAVCLAARRRLARTGRFV